MALTKLNNNSLHAITDGSALKNVTGTVLQVAQTLHGDTTNFSGTTHTEYTALNTTITPKATGSHILCQVIITFSNNYTGGAWYETFLYRDSTSNLVQEQEIYFNSQFEVIGPRPMFNVIDTTDTTAGVARTYKVFLASQTASGGSLRLNWPGSSQAVSSMTLTEIAG